MKKKTITILEITRREIITQLFSYAQDVYLIKLSGKPGDGQQETNIDEILAYTTALTSPQKMKQMLKEGDICPAIIFDIAEIEDLLHAGKDIIVRIMDDDEEVQEDNQPVLWLELKSDELGQW